MVHDGAEQAALGLAPGLDSLEVEPGRVGDGAGAVLQVPNLATQIITATIMATEPPPSAVIFFAAASMSAIVFGGSSGLSPACLNKALL